MSKMWNRRIPVALVVAMSAFAVSAGAVGFASAADANAMPAEFGIAEPMGGDRVEYSMELSGGFKFDEFRSEDNTTGPVITWTADQRVRDADGILHVANLHTVDTPRYLPFEMPVFHFDPETGMETTETRWVEDRDVGAIAAGASRPFAHGDFSLEETQQGQNLGAPVNLNSDMSRQAVVWNFFSGFSDCFALTPLQGASLETADRIAWPGCYFGPLPQLSGAYTARAVGVEHVDDVRAVRYDLRLDLDPMTSYPAQWVGNENGGVSMWFVPELAYPIQVTASFFEEGVAHDALFRMVAFQPGAVALSGVDDANAPPAPELEFVPWTEIGPDASGFDSPFTLDEAVDAALNDLSYSDARDFLAANPDAYVAAARFDQWETYNGAEYTWEIAWRGQDDVFGVEVTARDRVALTRDLGVPLREYEFSDHVILARHYAEAAPAEPPALAPSVASAMARWTTYISDHREPAEGNSYTFGFRCWSDCEEPMLFMEVGHNEISFKLIDDEDPTAVYPAQFYWSYLAIMEGQTQYLVDFTAEGSTRPTVSADASPEEGVPPAQAAYLGGLWGLPTPAQAAGAGILAILAGLLYYLWPLLKAGPMFGLFSRVSKDQLAEHPLRASVLQLVEAEPGIHFQAMRRRLDAANGTLVHHVRKLVDAELLTERKTDGYTCYFLAGQTSRQVIESAPTLRSEGARTVLQAIYDWPGATGKKVAEVTGLSPATVSYHMKRLREAGLVDGTRGPGGLRLQATTIGHNAVHA